MGSLSLTPDIRIFACPHCAQTINTSMQQCPFCHAPVDHAAAQAASDAMACISRAVSDASYLRVMVGLLVPFFFLQLLPFFSFAGVIGFWFLRLAIVIMSVRWFIKYGRIQTTDPDFAPAKRRALTMGLIGLAVLLATSYRVFIR